MIASIGMRRERAVQDVCILAALGMLSGLRAQDANCGPIRAGRGLQPALGSFVVRPDEAIMVAAESSKEGAWLMH